MATFCVMSLGEGYLPASAVLRHSDQTSRFTMRWGAPLVIIKDSVDKYRSYSQQQSLNQLDCNCM